MKHNSLHILMVAVVAMAVTACASIGRPEGGPRDEKPPVYVTSNPPMGALNFNKAKMQITFNENVQLQDAATKLVVSPPQKTPRAFANGKHVTIEFQDTLLPNTTYTIDFGDAIKDLNEGNILDGFSTYFSTGDSIDSLRISGMVLEAQTLEPAQGILVGAYSNLSDTAITTQRMERVARTNQYGQFTIHNLKPIGYRLFALNDVSNDFMWQRTEDIAFYDSIITPWVENIEVTDTLRSSEGTDSLVTRKGYAYYPNDVLLTWFNEGFKRQYMPDKNRPDRRRIEINMGAPADTLPEITIAKGEYEGRNIDDWALLKKNATLDSLQYWIRDSLVYGIDSLYLSVRYQATDTADMLSWRTDTLKFFFKDPPPKKKSKKEIEADTLPPPTVFMKFSSVGQSAQEVYNPLIFAADAPIDSINPMGVHLEMQQDTLWLPIKDVAFTVDSLDPLLRRRITYPWAYGQRYRLTVDSASVTSIYGLWNNAEKHEFTVRKEEDYSNLMLNVSPYTDSIPMMVEVLSKADEAVRIAPVIDGTATFRDMTPGTYYARLYIDTNGNGKWDTGNLQEKLQPEEMYYFPKKLNLKRNWDVAQSWNIYEQPLDMQKPYDIKKNKPKLKKGEERPTGDEEDEYGDELDVFGGTNSTYSNSRNQNNGYGNQNSYGRGGNTPQRR